MKRKILRSLWIIPVIIGVILIIFGITKLIKANSVSVPDMGTVNWFESSTSREKLRFTGIAMLFGGIFLSLGVSFFLFVLFKNLTFSPTDETKTLEKIKEYNKKISKNFS